MRTKPNQHLLNAKKSPANGLYYVDAKMIWGMSPCGWRYGQYRKKFGTGRVLITAQNLLWMIQNGGMVGWFAYRMESRGKLTLGERRATSNTMMAAREHGGTYDDACRCVARIMTMLEDKAARDGLLKAA